MRLHYMSKYVLQKRGYQNYQHKGEKWVELESMAEYLSYWVLINTAEAMGRFLAGWYEVTVSIPRHLWGRGKQRIAIEFLGDGT